MLLSQTKQEHQSAANMAKEPMSETSRNREDRILSALAEKRDNKAAKRIKHEAVLIPFFSPSYSSSSRQLIPLNTAHAFQCFSPTHNVPFAN